MNEYDGKMKEKVSTLSIITFILLPIGLLVGIGWLIKPYIIRNPELQVLGYSSVIILALSYLILMLSPYILERFSTNHKKLFYIIFSINSVLLITSLLGVSFIVHKSDFKLWLNFLPTITMPMGFITMKLSELISKERKKLLVFLEITTLILWFTGLVFLSL